MRKAGFVSNWFNKNEIVKLRATGEYGIIVDVPIHRGVPNFTPCEFGIFTEAGFTIYVTRREMSKV